MPEKLSIYSPYSVNLYVHLVWMRPACSLSKALPDHCDQSLDWVTEFLLGASFESLPCNSRINTADFTKAVEQALKGITRRVMLSPVLSLLPKDQAWHNAFNKVNELFEYHIDLAIANYHDKSPKFSFNESNPEKAFVMLRELVKESQDRDYLRDQLVSMFLPAFQAFPMGLADVLFQVARAPHVWTKLRAETMVLGDVQLTFEVLKSMQYLQCVIKESESPCIYDVIWESLTNPFPNRFSSSCAPRSNSAYV